MQVGRLILCLGTAQLLHINVDRPLPQFIDQMTPGGQMPSPGGIEGALADLSRMMPRG